MADSQRAQIKADRKQWIEKRRREPVIGVLLVPDEAAGVRIAGVTPEGAAAQAGLQAGDRIVSIDQAQVLGSSGKLRVENARQLLGKLDTTTPVRIVYLRNDKRAVANLTPRMGERIVMLPEGAAGSKRIRILRGDGGHDSMGPDHPRDMVAPRAASQIHREIIRLGPNGECKGEHCKTPRLLSAFRWNGLNLASLDPQLGRYFGTDKGVLVLSSGELDGLQSGDVIQSVDGRPVDSPREVMDALRDKPANARVAVGYMRDRKTAKTNVTVPEVMRDLHLPPAPPAPPRPPSPPRTPATPAPPAPAAPPAANIDVPPLPPLPRVPPVLDT